MAERYAKDVADSGLVYRCCTCRLSVVKSTLLKSLFRFGNAFNWASDIYKQELRWIRCNLSLPYVSHPSPNQLKSLFAMVFGDP